MSKKKSQIEKAIESIEADIQVSELALAKLKAQQRLVAPERQSAKVARPRPVAQSEKVG